MLNPDTRLRRRPELLATGMGHEVVMLDMESGQYFGLSGVGPHIWEQLEQSSTVREVAAAVKAGFAADSPERVDRDVLQFLQTLHDKGLVTVVE